MIGNTIRAPLAGTPPTARPTLRCRITALDVVIIPRPSVTALGVPPGPGTPREKIIGMEINDASRHRRVAQVERVFENVIFGSRWILAPFYLGLSISLCILLVKFVQQAFELLVHAVSTDGSEIIVGILALIDLSLMANLLLMVIFAGYESFVSRLDVDGQQERLQWMGQVGFGDLKLKLMASIVAISAIHLLEAFMNADNLPDRKLGWLVGIHMAFVTSGVLLALMDRVAGRVPH